MTEFERSGHWRTNANGTTFWVSGHHVHRDQWDVGRQHPSPITSALVRAADLLLRNNVGSGRQACFVNPNARCPICSKPVFYYANAAGSRVFFDDLGPPWPKHPCTDSPRMHRQWASLAWTPIVPRNRGQARELVEAANLTGRFNRTEFGRPPTHEWTLIVVESVRREADLNHVVGRVLDSLEDRSITINFRSERPMFAPGDFVSAQGKRYSFFDRKTMTEVGFVQNGEAALLPLATEADEGPERVSPSFDESLYSLDGWQRSDCRHFENNTPIHELISKYVPRVRRYIEAGARRPEDFAKLLNADRFRTAVGSQWDARSSRYLVFMALLVERSGDVSADAEMTEFEALHFNAPGIGLEALLKHVAPALRDARRMRRRQPGDLAAFLNRQRRVTAIGARWSPRLIGFLIRLVDWKPATKEIQATRHSTTGRTLHPVGRADEQRKTLTMDEMALMLSSLGRVRWSKSS